MPRPCCCRRISGTPVASLFKPAGVPARALDRVVLALDELEALRLADLEGRYQEQAAERMDVSRATFGRILDSAHRKVAEALIGGKALRIEGGPVSTGRGGRFRCRRCAHRWEGAVGEGGRCPRCQVPDAAPGTLDAGTDGERTSRRGQGMGQTKNRTGRPERLPREKPE